MKAPGPSATGLAPAIAIVGGGASGCLVATQILRQARRPLKLYLIEGRASFGTGVAYSTAHPEHLLNVPAGKMNALPDDSEHFLNWYRSEVDPGAGAGDFVSRVHYGRYLEGLLDEAEKNAAGGAELHRVVKRAVSVRTTRTGFSLNLQDSASLAVDALVLALGNSPPSDPLEAAAVELPWAWSPQALNGLGPDQDLLLLGSGLTAVDIILAVMATAFTGTIHVISRRGLWPHAHRSYSPIDDVLADQGNSPSLRKLLRTVRRRAAELGATGTDWRAVVDALRPHTNQLWRSLSLAEQARFLRHLRPYWEIHRHRMAPAVAARLHQLVARGTVALRAGSLAAVERDSAAGRLRVAVRLRGGGHCELEVARIINCMGPECDYRKIDQPFVRSLMAQGLIHTDPLRLGLATDPAGQLLDDHGHGSGRLWAIGPVCKGGLWETTAIPEIRTQAQEIARLLLKNLDD